ncbi:hypothetical protein FJZ53_03720 [Candidatus Woesearchaeota archaeon]|nr:hypothetical protein [Candidatus Woesearchaeota archaeon]
MIIRLLALNLIILALALNNIDFIKTAGKNFVAATLGPTVPACTNADDGAYWNISGYSVPALPCCGVSCGCESNGTGCSKCCPTAQDPGATNDTRYFCDVTDLNQCLYCFRCTGGATAKCSSQEANECEADCGAAAQCDDMAASSFNCTGNIDTGGYCGTECTYTAADNRCEANCTGYNGLAACDEKASGDDILYCTSGSTFIGDECSATCTGQDRAGETTCRSAGSLGAGDGCTAEAVCNGIQASGGDIVSCAAGNAFIADECSATCTAQDRVGENICRSSDFAGGCTAEPACNGLIVNTCNNGTVYCDATCASSSGLGADGNGNGIDDGCDEQCDGIDNDGDTLIDEDVTRACQDYTLGVCATGTQLCTGNNTWGTCQNKTNEICNNGLDDDCDGKTDCLDEDCFGLTDEAGKTCCRDAGGFQNASCPADSNKVYDSCVDDNTQSWYYYDYYCRADTGYCDADNLTGSSDCSSGGCCFPSGGVSVCTNDSTKGPINIDGEASLEMCCAGDWKGANCTGGSCTSTDAANHDCCSASECTNLTTGDCGSIACETNSYTCTVSQNTTLCAGLPPKGVCGVPASNCSSTPQGGYNSYACGYTGDNTKCDDSDYCIPFELSYTCVSACTSVCVSNCSYCYSDCSLFVRDEEEDTLPNDLNSCVKHGCWTECVT